LRAVALGLGGALALIVISSGRSWLSPDVPAEELLVQARLALEQRDYDRAESLASRIERGTPVWRSGQIVAGEAATRAGRHDAALVRYAAIPRDGSPEAVLAAFAAGELYRDGGQLTKAVHEYAYVLEHEPDHALAHERMAFLLGATARRWEALPHFLFLVRSRNWTLDSLALLGDLERPLEQGAYLRTCAEKAPHDVLVALGLAGDAVAQGRAAEARHRLEDVIRRAPHLLAAQAMLGELLLDAEQARLLQWHAALPRDADDYADIWLVRGLWARRQGALRVAARCFWETVRRIPTHRRGNYHLGQVLIALGETSGEEFAARSGQLFELTSLLDRVLSTRGRDQSALRRVMELTEDVGRVWEAGAWATTAARLFPQARWPQMALERLSRQLHDGTPHTLASANLALKYDFSAFASHEALFREAGAAATTVASGQPAAAIRFEEVALEAGVEFVYDNAADPSTPGARQFEQTGGGVAVLDFDVDGWPDLYFTQGAAWTHGAPQPTPSPETIDRLYQNVGGGSFVDATVSSGLGDHGFGQGCAAGDFDNDGFADLYVANFGRNSLWHNNGDGTFSDITEASGLEGQEWTASCVLVDLNADGCADLYDVNYLTGPRIHELICNGRACSPKVFDGAPDHVHLSRGDGTFRSLSDATPREDSKGLGVVAAVIGERGRPCLFIANDQVPNFLLRSQPTADPLDIRFRDEGFVSGVAFNESGLAMAGMGIAADDADGDGRIDFFVTNFKDESNTLYLQDAEGLFVDATNAAGLRAPSWPFVGWGTQFLDADLDGNPDLVVTNGHVDDYRDDGGEYHMRPQFFRNTGGGRFLELSAGEIGPYFGRKHLGRGLARLDWNGDGRMDFAVANIGEPAALVTNASAGVGRFLSVRLHARTTARDAIGTAIEITAGPRHWTKQLVAGDGYMASNERVLQFGLGPAASVSRIRITWPSGATSEFRDLPVDRTVDAVEGRPPLVP
jgi:tetratricopeptide (TPR) repeat protein